jgi:hypothetical protein
LEVDLGNFYDAMDAPTDDKGPAATDFEKL